MKVFDTIGTTCKKVATKVNDKSLALAVGTMTMIGASSANAADAITLTEGTGFSGKIDPVYYLTATALVVGFLGLAVAITNGIRTLRKA